MSKVFKLSKEMFFNAFERMVPKRLVFPKLFYWKIIGFKRGTFTYVHFDPKDMLKIKPNGFERGTFIGFEARFPGIIK